MDLPQNQPILFTPGPLLTTMTVKQAQLVDMGSRDPQFMAIIQDVRQRLLQIAQVDEGQYTAILLQGSGTYAIEATLQSVINNTNEKVLVVANGSYGERQIKILQKIGKKFDTLIYEDNQIISIEEVLQKLREDDTITHLSLVHSETTSGIINSINFLQQIDRKIIFIVDAVSSFGAYDIPMAAWNIDFLISSSNKCLQGVPGFAFVISNLKLLQKCQGNAISLVLDLYDQEQQLKLTQQFRFTPPTHALRAFKAALLEHEQEGGCKGRYQRYLELQCLLSKKMTELGFQLYLEPQVQGCIITTFKLPTDANFSFQEFYDYLAINNILIYPGKTTKYSTFRIGSIGALTIDHMNALLGYIGLFLKEHQIAL